MEIKRNQYLNALINRMHNGMIKVITGIRRAGKSYILWCNLRTLVTLVMRWIRYADVK